MSTRSTPDAYFQTKAALEADHYAFSAHYLQAEIYDAKGNHDQANKIRNDAETAIRKQSASEGLTKNDLDVGDPRVLFLNDSLWNEESGDPAEIVAILEPRTVDLSAFERVELATSYFALGRTKDGKQEWEKAIASDSKFDTAVDHAHLGEHLVKASALADALPHLQRAYELDPQNITFRMEYDAVRQRLGK